MEQRGLKQADLVPIFKSRGYVSDVINGKRAISKVHADIEQIAMQADVRERIAQLGLEASLNSPEEFAVVIKSDTVKWAKVIRTAGIRAE